MIDDTNQPLLDDVGSEQVPQGSDWHKALWKFILCSACGVALFMVPLTWNDKVTILLGVFTDYLQDWLGVSVKYMALAMVTVSCLGAVWVKALRPDLSNHPVVAKIFDVSPWWLIIRLLGVILIWMIFLQVGPKWIIDRNTGGVIYEDLVPVLLPLWFFAILLLPLLTDYGLMEYFGTMVRKVFTKLFRLPGRAAIDALSSWFGAASIGLLVTMQQFDKSFYSQREASIIATTFSVTSIAFTYVVAKTIGVENQFVWFYAAIALSGFTAALIMPRIPPLSLKKDTYYSGHCELNESIPEGYSTSRWALNQAVTRAYRMPKTTVVFKRGLVNLFDIYLGLFPAIFVLGTFGLALTEYTSIFKWLSYPIVPFLELLRIPEAASAAPAMLVGFADMYLPALVGKSIEADLTRFVIGAASITQIIYMSEVGALILKSNIKLNILELFAIFILRTLITVPIIALVAHWIY